MFERSPDRWIYLWRWADVWSNDKLPATWKSINDVYDKYKAARRGAVWNPYDGSWRQVRERTDTGLVGNPDPPCTNNKCSVHGYGAVQARSSARYGKYQRTAVRITSPAYWRPLNELVALIGTTSYSNNPHLQTSQQNLILHLNPASA